MIKLNTGIPKNLGIANGIDPCPFCGAKEGGNGPILGQDGHRWMITCLGCNVQFIDDRKDKVQSHWNMRQGMVKKYEVVKLIKQRIIDIEGNGHTVLTVTRVYELTELLTQIHEL